MNLYNYKKSKLLSNNQSTVQETIRETIKETVQETIKETVQLSVQSLKKILIVLPTYNRINNIENIIEMMQNQKHTNFTLLIIDDSSTNGNLLELKTKYIKDCRFVFLRNNVNLNIPKTLNIGLKYFLENDYDYFTYISDSNIYYPTFLEELISNKTSLFNYTGHHYKTDKMALNHIIDKTYNFKSYNHFLKRFNGLYSFIWHKDAIKKIGKFI